MRAYKGHIRACSGIDVGIYRSIYVCIYIYIVVLLLLSLVWGWRTAMFQLSGSYCNSRGSGLLSCLSGSFPWSRPKASYFRAFGLKRPQMTGLWKPTMTSVMEVLCVLRVVPDMRCRGFYARRRSDGLRYTTRT